MTGPTPLPTTHATTLAEMFATAVAAFGPRPALDFMGRKTSYAELGREVAAVTAGLQALGVVHGTRVAMTMPNCPATVILYFAIQRAGGIVVALNPLYVEREIAHLLRDSGAEIVCLPNLSDISTKVVKAAEGSAVRHIVACDFAAQLPAIKRVLFRIARRAAIAHDLSGPRFVSFQTLLRTTATPVPVAIAADDPAALQYTGGTTGLPKAAVLTQANLLANFGQVVATVAEMPGAYRTAICVLPLFHVFAMMAILISTIGQGGEIVLVPRFEVKDLLKTIARTRPTAMFGVPTIYTAILREPSMKPADLASIVTCVSGGAPLPAEIRTEFERITGVAVREGYGLSETSPVVTMTPHDGGREGSCGRIVAGTRIAIRDLEPPHADLAIGERGVVWINGPQVMQGYWNRPEETAKALVDGWFNTGDVGYLDEDGFLYLIDRTKDLILCSGYNVYPRVIEEALYAHPAVLEAVVIGVPDAHRGQAPKAFVVLRSGQHATVADLRAHLTDHVSKIEMPREIEFRDSLPKTLIGKLSKKELVEEEAAKRAAAEAPRSAA